MVPHTAREEARHEVDLNSQPPYEGEVPRSRGYAYDQKKMEKKNVLLQSYL